MSNGSFLVLTNFADSASVLQSEKETDLLVDEDDRVGFTTDVFRQLRRILKADVAGRCVSVGRSS
jgi:hypothetical protein